MIPRNQEFAASVLNPMNTRSAKAANAPQDQEFAATISEPLKLTKTKGSNDTKKSIKLLLLEIVA